MRPVIEALVERDGEESRLSSPRLGRFTSALEQGQIVAGGQRIGTLRVLSRVYDVIAPSDVSGRISSLVARRRETPVEFGERLCTLAAIGDVPAGEDTSDDATLAAGQRFIRAQMDGQLYLHPAPDEPPFVSPGQRIVPGDTLATIEVMKFFYPMVFEDAGPAVVVSVVAADATPVAPGDPLFVIEPER